MNYCVGLVIYNPSLGELEFINTYINSVDKVYIYDNSDVIHKEELAEILKTTNYEYFFNGKNEGISIPFNNMMKIAEKESMDYMIMLDQDSKIEKKGINKLKDIINGNSYKKVFSCNVIFEGESQTYPEKLKTIKFAITSGTVIDISYFNTLHGYDEKLFIDGVDRDFCLKLAEANEMIYQMNNVFLFQQLGNRPKNLLGIYEHSPIRNYYIFRNRLYLMDKYPNVFQGLIKFKSKQLSILKQYMSILLFEKDKMDKFRFIKKAKNDYKKGKMYQIKKEGTE